MNKCDILEQEIKKINDDIKILGEEYSRLLLNLQGLDRRLLRVIYMIISNDVSYSQYLIAIFNDNNHKKNKNYTEYTECLELLDKASNMVKKSSQNWNNNDNSKKLFKLCNEYKHIINNKIDFLKSSLKVNKNIIELQNKKNELKKEYKRFCQGYSVDKKERVTIKEIVNDCKDELQNIAMVGKISMSQFIKNN